jgi:PilZ domain
MSERNGWSESESESKLTEAERRSEQRFPCNLVTTGHVLGPRGNISWVARVANISTKGVGLLYRSRVKPGTVLVITLQGASQKLSRPLPVRVMHVRQENPDTWLLGCEFVRRINEEDLHALLAQSQNLE